MQVHLRDGALQWRGGAPRDPRLHHQRVRAPPQGGAQAVSCKGKEGKNRFQGAKIQCYSANCSQCFVRAMLKGLK